MEQSEALYRALTAVVQAQRLDVFALQEATVVFDAGDAQVQRVGTDVYINGLLEESRFTTAFPQGGDSKVRNPILTRLPIKRATSIPLHPDASVGTPASRFIVRRGDRAVVVYNVHLRSYNASGRAGRLVWWDLRDWLERFRIYKRDVLARSYEAARLRESLEAEELPFIVGGDLNATPHNWSYALLMRGAGIAPVGSVRKGTFPSRFPLIRIDYIIVSRSDWAVASATVVDPRLSDHRLMVAELLAQPAEQEKVRR